MAGRYTSPYRIASVGLTLFLAVCLGLIVYDMYSLHVYRKTREQRRQDLNRFCNLFFLEVKKNPGIGTVEFIDMHPEFHIQTISQSDIPEPGKSVVLCEHFGRSSDITGPVLVEFYLKQTKLRFDLDTLNCVVVRPRSGNSVMEIDILRQDVRRMYESANDPRQFQKFLDRYTSCGDHPENPFKKEP